MIALITGASSGIGREIAYNLAGRGINLILVARRRERLEEVKAHIAEFSEVKVKLICKDLSDEKQCYELFNEVSAVRVDILVNNAGFGLFGSFSEADLGRELEMINVNIRALHILTKLFYRSFSERNSGYILNVASIAGEMAGPMLSTYYATKNYVVQLTKAISEEIRVAGSKVSVSVLCPGPVKTEFNDVAGTNFALSGQEACTVAEIAVSGMFKRKLIIHPSTVTKLISLAERVTPTRLMLMITEKTAEARQFME